MVHELLALPNSIAELRQQVAALQAAVPPPPPIPPPDVPPPSPSLPPPAFVSVTWTQYCQIYHYNPPIQCDSWKPTASPEQSGSFQSIAQPYDRFQMSINGNNCLCGTFTYQTSEHR